MGFGGAVVDKVLDGDHSVAASLAGRGDALSSAPPPPPPYEHLPYEQVVTRERLVCAAEFGCVVGVGVVGICVSGGRRHGGGAGAC